MRRSLLVAILGPDGSGKSTTGNYLEQLCQASGVETHRYHWRPRVLPSLRRGEVAEIDTRRPDELTVRPWLLSVATCIYFYLDFLAAHFVRSVGFNRHSGVIIHERFFYDVLFHPRRYKLGKVSWLSRFLVLMMPRPDLTVILWGDPDVIRSRKPELPLGEIVRQQAAMTRMFRRSANIIRIDVTNEPSLVVAETILERIRRIDGSSE